MIVEIKVPSPGESISEVEVGKWLAEDGAIVAKGQELAEIESDKATLTVVASAGGKLKIFAAEGARVAVGGIACTIDTNRAPAESEKSAPKKVSTAKTEPTIVVTDEKANAVAKLPEIQKDAEPALKMTPTARAVMEQANLNIEDIINGVKRLNRKDMEQIISALETPVPGKRDAVRTEERTTMTPLRRKLSQRLVAVKNETAMLTTFNEVDMSRIMEMRNNFQKAFSEKYGFKLGFNALFAKAASIALSQHPSVNSMIDGEEIVTPGYHDIGIAVSSPKGLMVPVIRNVESKDIGSIEGAIKDFAEKARDKRLSVQEMTGGTFTITNGGVFGSMMSTPIINPPQSAILGLHAIKDRPVAIDGQVVIRPMMYIALSYDHRLIDGKDSVGFLVKIKELIENPEKMLFDGKASAEILLGL